MNTIDNYKKIKNDDLFLGLIAHGLFADKLPPIFTSENFYNWAKNNPKIKSLKPLNTDYIRYHTIRNTHELREIGIPHPLAYLIQCLVIKAEWENIKKHFEEKTKDETHKVSRVHIRKLKNSSKIFEMNYVGGDKFDDTCIELAINKKFVVNADISNCFPSIYSHAIAWALVGKEDAKKAKSKKKNWYNKLDEVTRNIKYGETHGLLIGPHSSNLISEIILVCIDYSLVGKGYKYIRHIDDYTCYTDSHEKAEEFLRDLDFELRKYHLALNTKKSIINKLPISFEEEWVNKLSLYFTDTYISEKETKTALNKKELKKFLNLVIELFLQDVKNNGAIVSYAIKMLAKKQLNTAAKKYYISIIHHLVLLYPYLTRYLDEFIFIPHEIDCNKIVQITKDLYQYGVKNKIYEASIYAMYFAIKYREPEIIIFEKPDEIFKNAESSEDCIFILLCYYYEKINNDRNEILSEYKKYAKNKADTDFDKYWLLCYEVLDNEEIKELKWIEEIKQMKKNRVSFIDLPNI